MRSIRTHVRRTGQSRTAYAGNIVTLREFESRDEPRRAVVGTPDAVTPPEWTPGPVTNRERVWRLASGAQALVGLLRQAAAAVVLVIRSLS